MYFEKTHPYYNTSTKNNITLKTTMGRDYATIFGTLEYI